MAWPAMGRSRNRGFYKNKLIKWESESTFPLWNEIEYIGKIRARGIPDPRELFFPPAKCYNTYTPPKFNIAP